MALAGDGQDGRCVFSLVKEDRRLVGCLQFDLGGAWRALGRGWLTLLTAAAAAVHERLTQSLKHRRTFGCYTDNLVTKVTFSYLLTVRIPWQQNI